MCRFLSLAFFLPIILFLLYSCGRKPSYVLPEDKMKEVLTDMYIAKAIYNNSTSDFRLGERRDMLMQSVLDKHGITKAELDSSLVWYADDINIYMKMNDSIASQLRRKGQALSKAMDDFNAIASRDYGILPKKFYLSTQTPILSFYIDSIKIKTVDLNTFKFSFHILGLNQCDSLDAAVRFYYKDTTVCSTAKLTENAPCIFFKPQLADSLLKNISGYVRYRGANDRPPVVLYNIAYQDSIITVKPADGAEEILGELKKDGAIETHTPSKGDLYFGTSNRILKTDTGINTLERHHEKPSRRLIRDVSTRKLEQPTK